MKVSNRQRRILEALLNRQAEVTAGQLAQELQVSARTVHRELRELEPLLSAHGLALVKKSGIGISLEGQAPMIARFQEELRLSETETYSPEERKVLMLCSLLEETEPVKLFALAREVQAAIPTVSRDLDELEPQLVRSGLELVRRRGYGVEIAGPETAKRQLIAAIAEEYLDHADWFGGPGRPGDQWPVTRRLLELAGKETFLQIEPFLWQQAEEWISGLKESDYTRLLIRLSVAVTRIRRGRLIPASESQTSSQPVGTAEQPPPFDLDWLTRPLMLELPEAEAAYLRQLFEEAKEKAADVSAVILEKYGLDLAERAIELIRAVERGLEAKLGKDRSLLDGLIRHLGPALERIRRGESIRNPLLQQIRKDYEDLFAVVKRCAAEIWTEMDIPDEEIGFLTMHFGAAMERWMLMPEGVRALLVCTSGIGSSKLLAVRISKEIPQIELAGLYSWYEASRVPEDQYDLIISTVDLPVEPERYIKLSPLLTREETERLRFRVRGITPKRRHHAGKEPRDRGAWERMKELAKHYTVAAGLLEPFQVYERTRRPGGDGTERMLAGMIRLLAKAWPPGHEGKIVQALLERETQGSVIIPDTELALYHTRSEWVKEPVLALFRLEEPFEPEAHPGARIRQALLMLAPVELGKEVLEMLSEISALLLFPETARMLEAEDADTIRAYFSRHLEAYIKNKLDWRDAV